MQNNLTLVILLLSLVLFGCIDNLQGKNNQTLNDTTNIISNEDDLNSSEADLNSSEADLNSSEVNLTNDTGSSSNLLDLGIINGSEEFYYIENGTPVNYLENASELNSTALKGGVKLESNTSKGVRTVLWQGKTETRPTKELDVSQKTPGCPHEILGNPSANLTIKYFWASTCPWCARFDPYVPLILQEQGDSFVMEKYDVFKCTAEIVNYGVVSTPTFIFSTNSSEGVYVIGYRSMEEFQDMICYYGGSC